jgi:UDP-GlcNAc:undecaprenyl-phosphate GlcNAc-1-phosphate transferase
MAPVLVGVYPLLETLYSMYRRKFVRSHPINHPDALHLHTLIYRRLVLNPALDVTGQDKNRANAKVAVIVWGFVSIPIFFAYVFRQQTEVLLSFIAIFAIAYVWFYKQLIAFKAPIILMSERRRNPNNVSGLSI